jgi:regulator of cell morphogenesis and NO signaling
MENPMNTIATKTVRELALENPGATRVFEKLGIDYCCGGQKPLGEACAAANVSLDEVLTRLQQAETQAVQSSSTKDWQTEPISALLEHILATHHVYVKEETPRIQQLLTKVVSAHGQNHPELLQVQEIFSGLAQELSTHLMKEEQILFPYLFKMEEASTRNTQAPSSCFGTVQNPIRMMMMEHDSAGDGLRELRQIASNYDVPADACVSYRTLYQAMEAFEKDLHQHIHLENNILFPRALAIENAAA